MCARKGPESASSTASRPMMVAWAAAGSARKAAWMDEGSVSEGRKARRGGSERIRVPRGMGDVAKRPRPA